MPSEPPDTLPVYNCRCVRAGFSIDGNLSKYPWTEVGPVWFLPTTHPSCSHLESLREKLHDPSYFTTGHSHGAGCNSRIADYQLTAFGACWSETHLYLAYRCMDA